MTTETWQVGASAAESYEAQLVPGIFADRAALMATGFSGSSCA